MLRLAGIALAGATLMAGCEPASNRVPVPSIAGTVTPVPTAVGPTPVASGRSSAAPGSVSSPAVGPLGVLNTSGDVSPVHDPSIAKDGDRYYLFSTGLGIPMRCSDDLLVWDPCGRAIETYPDWLLKRVPGLGDLWAPDISFRDGRFLLYYAASTFGSRESAIGLATNVTLDSRSPRYEWVDQGEVISTREGGDHNAIDPALAVDADGQPWLAFGSFWSGIKLVKLDPATYKPAKAAKLLPIAANPPTDAIEGAFITRRGNDYFLFVSHDLCCRGIESTYNIRVGRASAVEGPYVDRDGRPLIDGGGTLVYRGTSRWRGPGHNSILVEGSQYYMVYHSYDAEAAGTPTLRIESLAWDADGWPVSPSARDGR